MAPRMFTVLVELCGNFLISRPTNRPLNGKESKLAFGNLVSQLDLCKANLFMSSRPGSAGVVLIAALSFRVLKTESESVFFSSALVGSKSRIRYSKSRRDSLL